MRGNGPGAVSRARCAVSVSKTNLSGDLSEKSAPERHEWLLWGPWASEDPFWGRTGRRCASSPPGGWRSRIQAWAGPVLPRAAVPACGRPSSLRVHPRASLSVFPCPLLPGRPSQQAWARPGDLTSPSPPPRGTFCTSGHALRPGGRASVLGGRSHSEPGRVLALELPCVLCGLKQVTGPSLSRHRRVPRAPQGLKNALVPGSASRERCQDQK